MSPYVVQCFEIPTSTQFMMIFFSKKSAQLFADYHKPSNNPKDIGAIFNNGKGIPSHTCSQPIKANSEIGWDFYPMPGKYGSIDPRLPDVYNGYDLVNKKYL